MSNTVYFKSFRSVQDDTTGRYEFIEIATFEASMVDVINILEIVITENETKWGSPNLAIRGLLTFLEAHNTPGSAPVILYPDKWPKRYIDPLLESYETWQGFPTLLFENNIAVRIFCNECDKLYENPPLLKKEWSYDHGPFAAGAGTNWYCPKDHLVYIFQHFRS